jgi:hypothetical protein
MTARWTEETENIVAMELEDVLPREVGALPDEAFYVDARRVLAALAEAGLLLQPGGEVREEWGIEWGEGHRLGTDHFRSLASSERIARQWVAEDDKLTLVRRTIVALPWAPVEGGAS